MIRLIKLTIFSLFKRVLKLLKNSKFPHIKYKVPLQLISPKNNSFIVHKKKIQKIFKICQNKILKTHLKKMSA
jgi:hypothetical protein